MRILALKSCLLAGAVLQTAPAMAQSLSAADIAAQVDQRVGGLNEYQELLNDPDPQRAMAAMQIMLESDSPELKRMALEYGLFSPNEAVQRTAVDAFLASEPVVSAYFESEDGFGGNRFLASVGGSALEDGRGFLSFKVGKFDDEKGCYVKSDDVYHCRFRVNDQGSAIRIWDKWWSLTLDDQGNLVGSGDFPRVDGPTKVTIPVSQ